MTDTSMTIEKLPKIANSNAIPKALISLLATATIFNSIALPAQANPQTITTEISCRTNRLVQWDQGVGNFEVAVTCDDSTINVTVDAAPRPADFTSDTLIVSKGK